MSAGTPPNPAPAPAVTLAPGLVVADRFQLVHPLGEGGMGAVWRAQHVELDTPCALKFMHASAARSPEIAGRFKREARAAAQLRSPHVVQILDHGVWEGTPYIAMELLEGEDLHKRLRRVRVLSPREVGRIAAEVGRALTKAHAAGLVHRDLKPGNIFLVRDDDREIAKVLDFGVAKLTGDAALTEAHTTTGAVLGTPYYMSPEQLRAGKDVDHRADLWALSVVVYQCLTGQLPFRADVLAELVVKIMVDPIPVPSQVAPQAALTPAFDAWWARATDRNAERRFQTAKDLTEALAIALGQSLATTGPHTLNDGLPSSRGGVQALTGAGPIEELDSGLLRTAMPTVMASPTGSGSLQLTVPPEPRRRSPARFLVPAAGVLIAGAVVAAVALHGRDTAAPAAASPSAAPVAAQSVAVPEVPRQPPAPSVSPAPSADTAPAASADTAPSSPVKASPKAPSAPPPARTAAPSTPPTPAARPKAKHEGVTDF